MPILCAKKTLRAATMLSIQALPSASRTRLDLPKPCWTRPVEHCKLHTVQIRTDALIVDLSGVAWRGRDVGFCRATGGAAAVATAPDDRARSGRAGQGCGARAQ